MADYHTHKALDALDWYLIWTNPKCEARALAGLRAAGIAGYRPMLREVRVARGNRPRVTVERGMFVRYLFVGLDRAFGQHFADVRGCDGVEGLVSFADDGAPLKVPPADLRRVIAYEASGAADRPDAAAMSFSIGDKIRIIAGPFEGFEAEVCAYSRRRAQVTTEVMAFGRASTVRVGVDSVRKRA